MKIKYGKINLSDIKKEIEQNWGAEPVEDTLACLKRVAIHDCANCRDEFKLNCSVYRDYFYCI